MDATPNNFVMLHDGGLAFEEEWPGASPLALKWTALHAAAEVVASLSDLRTDAMPAAAEAFPRVIERAGGWRLDLADQGIDDIVAMMEPGLEALLTLHGQGGDPRAAALALWEEFDRARHALLALARTADEVN